MASNFLNLSAQRQIGRGYSRGRDSLQEFMRDMGYPEEYIDSFTSQRATVDGYTRGNTMIVERTPQGWVVKDGGRPIAFCLNEHHAVFIENYIAILNFLRDCESSGFGRSQLMDFGRNLYNRLVPERYRLADRNRMYRATYNPEAPF